MNWAHSVDQCRCCNFQCVSLICWAYFSDVMVFTRIQKAVVDQTSSRQQTVTMTFFWCRFGFEKCFGDSSWSSHWAGCHHLYKIHFLWHVTIWSRNGSLFYTIREHDTSKDSFWLAVSSWGTHLSSFFTFPTCVKCQKTVEWSTLNPLATSRVVVRGSASVILSVGRCQLPMATHYTPYLQGSHLLCKTSCTTTALSFC